MGRSQFRRREIMGIDSSDTVDESSIHAPKRTTTTAITAPTGTVTVGQTLTAPAAPAFTAKAQGGTITVTRQWVRGTRRDPIPGATGTTYVLVTADKTHQIRVQFIATYRLGKTVIESAPTSVVP